MDYSEHHYQSKDGLSLYYRDYGSGDEVILCLHGLTRNSKDFHKLALHLSKDYRVISVDIRGRGQSQWNKRASRYNPGQYVRDVWTLLDQLQLQQVIVIGTSLGGLMAMIMADQQAERVRAVILNDIGPELPLAAVQRILAYAGRALPAQNWEEAATQARTAYEFALPHMPEEFWHEFVQLAYRENEAGKPEPDMDPAIGTVLRNPPFYVRLLQWLHRRGWIKRVAGAYLDPWDSFRAMTMPCLLVQGVLSDVLTDEIVRKMQVAQTHMQVVRVADRGHTPLLDEPEAIAAIDAFLSQLRNDRG